jgi:AraC-like DNA-binding protein
MRLGPDVFSRLCRARELLSLVPEHPLSVQQVAAEVGISPFHFIRQFEALFGYTPHQFRIQSRLERAKLLLAAGHSVTEVCMEVGFTSLGSFSDLFKRRVGAAPTRYQRRVLVQIPGRYPTALGLGCLDLMGQLPADAFRSFREA